jgi:hypothetical protein
MMVIESIPALSATTLDVFKRCERLYEYASITRRPWPAPTGKDESLDDQESLLVAGSQLHQLIHLHARGLDPRPLAKSDPRLRGWFERYKSSSYAEPQGQIFSEQKLVLSLGGRKLVVKFDRLVRSKDGWLILDWKTGGKVPELSDLATQWQSKLYPFALVEAGALLNDGEPVLPEHISMVFYYLESGVERRLEYDSTRHEAVRRDLLEAIARISAAGSAGLPATGKENNGTGCNKPVPCRYYTLCHMKPAPPSEWREDEPEPAAPSDSLLLPSEFEFDDEPVGL